MAKQKATKTQTTEKAGVTTATGSVNYTFQKPAAEKSVPQVTANNTTANGSVNYQPLSKEAMAYDRMRRNDWRLNGTAERWTRDLDSIISYAQDESKGSREKTQSWYEQAKKNLEEIRSTLAGSENLDASSGSYLRKRAQNYEDVLDYLQDRTWYENSRDRQQAGAELAEAETTLKNLEAAYQALNNGGVGILAGSSRQEMERIRQEMNRQQSVIAQLQPLASAYNTTEEREQLIAKVRDPNAYNDLSDPDAIERAREADKARLRELDRSLYNGPMDYTWADRIDDTTKAFLRRQGANAVNAADAAVRGADVGLAAEFPRLGGQGEGVEGGGSCRGGNLFHGDLSGKGLDKWRGK